MSAITEAALLGPQLSLGLHSRIVSPSLSLSHRVTALAMIAIPCPLRGDYCKVNSEGGVVANRLHCPDGKDKWYMKHPSSEHAI